MRVINAGLSTTDAYMRVMMISSFAMVAASTTLRCQAPMTSGIADMPCDTGVGKLAATVDCHPPLVAAPDSAAYLFLLGYAYTGTSALHFILATSDSVSTVANSSQLGPYKEGWGIRAFRGKDRGELISYKQLTNERHISRWAMDADRVPWQQLGDAYHASWNLTKPVLLENSPPEIQFPERLISQFSNRRDVRFVVLTRSPCNERDAVEFPDRWSQHMTHIKDNIIGTFGGHDRRRIFLLRYEDLCQNMNRTLAALRAWLPVLGDLDPNAVPDAHRRLAKLVHEHVQVPIPQYCSSHALPSWPLTDSVPGNATNAAQLLAYFGYDLPQER